VYNWGQGNAGLLLIYLNYTATAGVSTNPSSADRGYKTRAWIFDPYVKAQIGPVYVEAEFLWWIGRMAEFENNITPNVNLNGWQGYASLTYDFVPMYAGLTLVYVAGNDPGDRTTYKAGLGGGTDFNPCLMLFNWDLGRWEGAYGSSANGSLTSMSNGGINNAKMAQVFLGAKPLPKLDIKASYTVAQADQDVTAVGWQSKDYGNELDITATYKIYDNLSYMLGFGYLWAGDYWKGTNSAASISNDYLITHKLTLTF
jgi:hypothetical protein